MKKISLHTYQKQTNETVKHYHKDLIYDSRIIAQKKPALFFVYECGSHAIELPSFDQYPAPGEHVRYLFGHADRDRILEQTGSTLQCESVINSPLKYYFDGYQMHAITLNQAITICADYKRNMRDQFHNKAA